MKHVLQLTRKNHNYVIVTNCKVKTVISLLISVLLLTAWNRVILQKPIVPKLVKTLAGFYGNPKVHYRFDKCLPPVRIFNYKDTLIDGHTLIQSDHTCTIYLQVTILCREENSVFFRALNPVCVCV
jgi:hypothetical protein